MMVHNSRTFANDFRENRIVTSATTEFSMAVKKVIQEVKRGNYSHLEYLTKCLENPKEFCTWMISITGVNDETAAVAAGLDVCDEECFTVDDIDRHMEAYRRSEAHRLGLPINAEWDTIKRKLSNDMQERLKSQGGVL
jgi:hypothetical protein